MDPIRLGTEAPPARPGARPPARTAPAPEPREVFTPSSAEAAEEAPARLGVRALAALALAVASATLAGCGAGPTDAPKASPSVAQPAKQSPTGASVPLQERLGRLRKEDKKLYKRLAEANLYRHVLQRIGSAEGPEGVRMASLARQGLEQFSSQDDPEKLRDGLKALVQQVADGPTLEGQPGAWQALARASLPMGKAISEATVTKDPGLVDRLKTAGYEKALEQVLVLPTELASRGMLDVEQARSYVEMFTDTAKLALEGGRELGDPALQAPLYEETLRQLYEKTGNDSSELARRLRMVLEIALKLKDKLPIGL